MRLRDHVLAFVLSRPESSSSEVLAAVSRHINSSAAAARGTVSVASDRKYRGCGPDYRRYWTTSRISRRGRQKLVSDCLRHLCDGGKIRRVRPGVYAPPTLKIVSHAG